MLLHNPGKPIQTTCWYMLELRSERTSEETIKRLGKAVRDTFPDEEVEVFVPVIERDLDVFTLMTECYVFLRADDPQKVAKLRRVTGIQGVLAKGDSSRVNKFLTVEDDYVQGLITTCHEHHLRRAASIREGSWVRLLDGQCKGYCGTVISIHDGRVLIQIEKRTKIINQETSIHNLLDMSHVPPAHRVFYYCSTVQHFLEEDPNAPEAIQPDLRFDEAALRAFLMCDEGDTAPVEATDGSSLKRHTSRGLTPTVFATSLLTGGETSIQAILEATAQAIQQKAVRAPKNATILWHVLREAVVKHFKAHPPVAEPGQTIPAPGPKLTYTAIEHLYGELTPLQVHLRLPELPLRKTKAAPGPSISTKTTISEAVRAELLRGNYDMQAYMTVLVQGVQDGFVRPPKHTESFASTIRTQVLRHFRASNPLATIVSLAEIHGDALRVAPSDVRTAFPGLDALLQTTRAQTSIQLPVVRRTLQVADVTAIIPKTSPTGIRSDRRTTFIV